MPLSRKFPQLPVRAPYPAGRRRRGAIMNVLVHFHKDRSTIDCGSAAGTCLVDAIADVLMLNRKDVRFVEPEAKLAALRG